MPHPRVRANHDELSQIARQFETERAAVQKTTTSLQRAMETLENGDWIGKSAKAFYGEMNSSVLPAMKRLERALDKASRTIGRVGQIMRGAEGEAAQVLDGSEVGEGGSGGGGAGVGGGAGGGAGGGSGGGAGGGSGGSAGGGAGGGSGSGSGGAGNGAGGSGGSSMDDLAGQLAEAVNENVLGQLGGVIDNIGDLVGDLTGEGGGGADGDAGGEGGDAGGEGGGEGSSDLPSDSEVADQVDDLGGDILNGNTGASIDAPGLTDQLGDLGGDILEGGDSGDGGSFSGAEGSASIGGGGGRANIFDEVERLVNEGDYSSENGNTGGGGGGSSGGGGGGGGEAPLAPAPLDESLFEPPTSGGGGGGGGGGDSGFGGGGSFGGGGGGGSFGGGASAASYSSLISTPPGQVFSQAYMQAFRGIQIAGANSPELRSALIELARNPTGAALEGVLAKIAALRGVPLSDIKAGYEKFMQVQAEATATAAANGEPPPPSLAEVFNSEYIGSTNQLRFGKVVGDVYGIDPVFGALLNPTGGMTDGGTVPGPETASAYNEVFSDAADYLADYHRTGPGESYLGGGGQSGLGFWASELSSGAR